MFRDPHGKLLAVWATGVAGHTMRCSLRRIVAALLGVAAAPIVFVSGASADTAQATIDELQSQGYVVAINWVDGNTGAPVVVMPGGGRPQPGQLAR